MIPTSPSYALGIDIGTTKVASAIVDIDTRAVLTTTSRAHESDVKGLIPGRSEQVVSRILLSLDACISELPLEQRQGVCCIGVTGQMHGVVLWNNDSQEVSHLVTWQDQRCLEGEFIQKLRAVTGDVSAQSGYGTSTLAWLAAHEPATLQRYTSAATIHDYLVFALTGIQRPVTDPSDAASFGFFNSSTRGWRRECIETSGIPGDLLPEIRPAGSKAGPLTPEWGDRWGLLPGIPVGTALGDNQASLYGSLTNPTQIALTIGTGAQLSVVVPQSQAKTPPQSASYEFRPYVGDTSIAVAASLSGGRALAALGKALQNFLNECGVANSLTLDQIQTAMHAQGLQRIDTDLRANGSLSGERHAPLLRGSFTDLSFDNFTIGDMTAALCRGLITSLRDSLPKELLATRREVVGSGNAIRRSPLMQQIIRETFGCDLTLQEGSETTACGAALLAADTLV